MRKTSLGLRQGQKGQGKGRLGFGYGLEAMAKARARIGQSRAWARADTNEYMSAHARTSLHVQMYALPAGTLNTAYYFSLLFTLARDIQQLLKCERF